MVEPRARGEIGRSTDSSSSMVKYMSRPLLLVALGYMDPGNWATAIEGGSRFGFELLWVVVVSNALALLFQTLATRLELVTGKHLAQICRDDYPQLVCTILWVLCEISILTLELTMVLGSTIGLNLLLGMPILPGVFLLVFDTLFFQLVVSLLGVQSAEFLTRTIIGVIVVCFVLDALLLSQPTAMTLAVGMWPTIRGETLYTAMALVGANAMPHTFYCHSPLAKRQITGGGQLSVETVCENSMRETIGAFGLALVANVALLIVTATNFYNAGLVVIRLQDAHALMEQVFSNSIAPAVFGLTMLCAGQLSMDNDGSLAGQAALEGFLETRSMHPWIHQTAMKGTAITLTAFCAWHYGDEGLYQLLVFAQVILALLIPFTAIPLIKASASEARMGPFRTSLLVEGVAWVSLGLVVAANIWLVFGLVFQEIDEFAAFSAHVEQLLGTENSFGSYGSQTINAFVFALALVGIGLCIGFLVWLVVTPLQIDRIAMERKWVEAYERFERNEVARELPVGGGASSSTKNSDLVIHAPTFMGEFSRKRGMKQTRDSYAWKAPSMQTSQINLPESGSSKIHELMQWPDVPQVFGQVFTELDLGMKKAPDHQRVIPPKIIRSFEDSKPATIEEPKIETLDKTKQDILSKVIVETTQDMSRRYGESSGSLQDSAEIFHVQEIVPQNLVCADSFGSSISTSVVQDEILAEIDYSEDTIAALPEPESQVLIEAELERLVTSSSSFSGDENPECAADSPADMTTSAANTKTVVAIPASAGQTVDVDDDVVRSADNCWESKGLKKAQMEVDAELLEKDDDEEEADGWDSNPEGLMQVDHTMVTGEGDLGASSMSSLTHEGPNSSTSVESIPTRTESSEGIVCRSGSGSLSQISQLGRAARRQFAVILDEFWSRLFDLHGQPIKWQPNAASSRMSGDHVARGARGAIRQQIDHSSPSVQSSSIESFSKENKHNLLLKSKSSLLRKGSGDQVGQMDTYMREHSHAAASASSSFLGHPHEYSGRPENLSPYAIGQQYSSLYFPFDSEVTDKQHTTERGPQSRSFVTRSAAAIPATAHLGMQAFGSSHVLSGAQALPQRTLGVGVERENKNYQLNLEDGYGRLADSGPRSWDTLLESAALGPLVYRATGELDIPTVFNHPAVVRGRVGSVSSSARGGSLASTQNGKMSQFKTAVGADGITDSSAKGVDLELEVMESLRLCLGKLLQLEGSEWLFRGDNGSDEDLIAAMAAAEKLSWETTDASHNHQYGIPGKQWIVLHNRPVQTPLLVTSNNESPGRISRCGGDFCIWGRGGLLISFGVWCMYRLLELSLMESRPELWGKYTYVLNRLQGILELVSSNSHREPPPSLCGCLLERGSLENLGKQVLGVTQQQRIFRNAVNADPSDCSSSTGGGTSSNAYPCDPWAAHDSTRSLKANGANHATIFLEMIKEVEAAVGIRKGRTGTAAGDVAFPKGKENLASVLKRYKRRLANKGSNSLVVGSGGETGGGQRASGYA
ncbi:hypothetical protein BDL97_01G186800 [Sphagnum fallax]|nr:hypothetical protein BDL97_01G186800 [Sphagnum fallax]KAH8975944.1 hypothetical protein BDL97_01G186800 [Sphagnum fallax]